MGNYLVTGAAGFIASRVSELLLEEGHVVVGLDNMNDSYDVRLKKWRLRRLYGHDRFVFHDIDICDRPALREVFENFDAVINLAARAGVHPSVANPFVYCDTNINGTLNLLELCREHDVGKFILASSSSLYGRNDEMPYREEIDTDHPLSPYAASKKAAEGVCYTYHFLHGIDVTVFRYFTVYGPAGRPDMSLFRFTQWISEERPVVIFGDGKQSRDFTYVSDIARGTVAGLKNVGYEVINLGTDKPVMLLDAVRIVEDAVGKKAKLEFHQSHRADVPATWADITKAKQLLGWCPQYDLSRGLQDLVEWYGENREWAKDVRTS
jgi:nucleoside-diphosphate-sugar epimerase